MNYRRMTMFILSFHNLQKWMYTSGFLICKNIYWLIKVWKSKDKCVTTTTRTLNIFIPLLCLLYISCVVTSCIYTKLWYTFLRTMCHSHIRYHTYCFIFITPVFKEITQVSNPSCTLGGSSERWQHWHSRDEQK